MIIRIPTKKGDTEEVEIDPERLNNTELVELCFLVHNKRPFIKEDRETLLKHLSGELDIINPVDDIRVHQITFLSEHWDTYSTIPCHTNCFAHCDTQVIECQVSNSFWLHDYLKKEK